MRPSRPLGLLFTTLVAVACAAAGASAQPLADRVPADAMVYVGWSGGESMGPGFAGSHLKAVLDESKFADFVSGSIPKLLQKIGMADREASEVARVMATIGGPLWRHPTAFYFGGLDMAGGQPTPKLAILCDAGADAKSLAAGVQKLLDQARGAPFKLEEANGLVVLSVGANNWGAAQKPAAPLSGAANFTAALAQAGQKDAVIAAYVDVDAIVGMVDRMVADAPPGQHWAAVRDALNLRGVRRAVFTAGFDGKDWATNAFVDAPAPRTGILPGVFDATPLSDDILKTIPQSATVAGAGKFDLGALIASVRSGVAKIDPNAGEMVAQGIGQVNQILGLDVQRDLFDLFGDEWAIYVDPLAAGNGLLGFTLVNRTRGGEKLGASLTKLEDMANALIRQNMERAPITLAFTRVPLAGTTLHQFAIPFVTPGWAIRDGNWYLGLYPQVVEAAVEQGGGKNKSILDNEDYVALRKRLGNQPASGVTFANLPKTAPEGYQEVLMMSRLYLGVADLFGGEVPPMLIPPLRKIMPHLSPAGGVSWADAAGWHHKSISPFPGAGLLTPGGGGQMMIGQQAMLVSILLPSLNRAREQANKVKCAANMSSIYKGMYLWSNDHKGAFPPDLGTVYLEEDFTPEVFVCPSTKNDHAWPQLAPGGDVEKWRTGVAGWITQNSDYVYLAKGMKNSAPADTIVLYEKFDNHNRVGINLCYGDGHIQFERMDEAVRQIEAQQQKKGGL